MTQGNPRQKIPSYGKSRSYHYEPSDFVHEEIQVPFREGWRDKAEHDALLCEGTALTSAIVDYLHGTLPTHPTDDDAIRGRIVNFVRCLIKAGHLVLQYKNAAYALRLDEYASKEEIEERSQYWHFFCELRRIFSRICRAIKGDLFLKNIENGKTSLEKKTIKQLHDLRFKLSSIVIDETRDMRTLFMERYNNSEDQNVEAHWYQVALFYEYSLIVRRQQLSGAMEACRFVKKYLSPTEHSLQGNRDQIIGGVSFNPSLFGEVPLNSLIKTSEKISLSTQEAAAQGLELNNPEWMDTLVEGLIRFVSNRKKDLKLSSLLHIESTVRVLSNNIIWNDVPSANKSGREEETRFKRSIRLLGFYNELVQIVDKNQEYDSWLRGFIKAKIKQDGGYLFSSILPVYYLDREYETSNDDQKSQFSEMDFMDLYLCGWEDSKDRPVEMRKELRRSLVGDLVHRSRNLKLSVPPGLSKIIDTIGIDPTETNPFTKGKSLVKWLWGEPSAEEISSRHINQFPQSDINKAHVSCVMAYLHCLKSHPDMGQGEDHEGEPTIGGFFSNLEGQIHWQDTDKKQVNHCWRIVSKQKARPQFTFGYFKGIENRKDIIKRSESEKDFKFNRSNLTRVNKVDALMYLANSLNFLEGLLYNQVNQVRMLKRINRASRTVQMHSTTIEDSIHIHDILHLSTQADQNPMRIWASMIEDKKYESATDQIFRTSFARLYALSRKTEVLAKIIKQKPLRQPYQSSAVLILDQIRVLLKFLHTDWLDCEEDFNKRYPDYEMDRTDSDNIAQIINFLDDKKRFPDKNAIRHESEDRNVFQFKTYVSTEFELSNMLSRRKGDESIRQVMNKSRDQLDFFASLDGWKELFNVAMAINYEGTRQPDLDEVEQLAGLFNNDQDSIDDDIQSWMDNEAKAIRAMQVLQSESKREWILWARLAFFPHLIDGKIMVSSTLTDSKRSKSLDQSLTSHTLKEAYFEPVSE